MSKILVIEPHRIMQQAIAIALYPENHVELMDAIPESLNVKDFDAVIVGAASLEEKSGLGDQGIHTIRVWKLPTIWIEDESSGQAPSRDDVVILKQPISRETLLTALGKCLRAPGSKRNGAVAEREDGPRRSKEAAKKPASVATESAKFIELVDVVEEGPGDKKNKTQKKKKN
jgi:hypothetical protein